MQPSQAMSLSLKHAVLPVATGRFSLVSRVKSWSNRLRRCYIKKGLWGQNGLTFLPGIAHPCCGLLSPFGRVYGAAQGMVGVNWGS